MPTDADSKKLNEFLEKGASFFTWNAGKNTPNILENFAKQVAELRKSMEQASASSGKLAEALNRLTLWGVVIGGLNLFVMLASFVKSFWPSR
jgi:hypothetical protein